jgi:hypothetical protein
MRHVFSSKPPRPPCKTSDFCRKKWDPTCAHKIEPIAEQRLSENRQKQAQTKPENPRAPTPFVRVAACDARLKSSSNPPARSPELPVPGPQPLFNHRPVLIEDPPHRGHHQPDGRHYPRHQPRRQRRPRSVTACRLSPLKIRPGANTSSEPCARDGPSWPSIGRPSGRALG